MATTFLQAVFLGWTSAPTSWIAPTNGTITLVTATIDTTTGQDAVLSTTGVSSNTALTPGVIFAANNELTGTQPQTVVAQVNFPVLKGQKVFGQGRLLFYFAS